MFDYKNFFVFKTSINLRLQCLVHYTIYLWLKKYELENAQP